MDEEEALNASRRPSMRALMDDESLDSDDEVEGISEKFMCCVCLDLLCKPIVLACGHISCFWCVDSSMNVLGESYCPICRCPYNHFPSICLRLHYLLLKMYPVAYKKREKQILEEEKVNGFFSPQLDDHVTRTDNHEGLNPLVHSPHSSTVSSQTNLCSDTCSIGKLNPSIIVEPSESSGPFHDSATTIPEKTCAENFETIENMAVDENQNDLKNETCMQVSVSDVLCAACNQLLFRPAVLNCGHVYCESCMATPMDEMLRCQVCQSLHPKGFPKVCLELDHFLEERFSKDYELRREAVRLKQVNYQNGSPSVCAPQAEKQGPQSSLQPTNNFMSCRGEHRSKVHLGFGCDSCGMFPIIGERYRCKDCVEEVGFDLCEGCYNTCSKLPGRFNQQHTPEHKFELAPLDMIQNMMRTIQSYDGSFAPIISIDDSLDPQNSVPAPILFGDVLEFPEDSSSVTVFSDDAPEDPEDATSVPILFSEGVVDPENGSGAHIFSDDAPEDPEGTHPTIQ